ncbi:MAG: MBL fold metallo-hydrolase [Patescibacteria group bacterium]
MKISFHGASREVTGSCILVETRKSKFLLDCGMFQGEDYVNNRNLDDFSFAPEEINFVLLTHAHIDHCGRLPKLYKHGFSGKIYSTAATRDLAALMLEDSAKIIYSEARDMGREPFYSEDDAREVMKLFHELPYGEEIIISNDVRVRLRNAGHILGSCFFEIWVKEGSEEKKIIYSGDLGNSPARIIKDIEYADGADIVIIESTYAGVLHESRDKGLETIRRTIIDCVKRKGTLMIPIFALEKVQEILYELNDLVENRKIPYVPIYLDSPLAIKATEIYKDYEDLYDKTSLDLIASGDELFEFPGLEFTLLSEDSKKINHVAPPKVVLAGGGMCNGGRITYHLKFNLEDKNSQVMLVAYQVPGSLGRKLLTGHKSVLIDNMKYDVKAKVSVINSYSAHADHDALVKWLNKMRAPKPKYVFLVHGEEKSCYLIAEEVRKKIKTKALIPDFGQVYEF